jgi:hypothetical protein
MFTTIICPAGGCEFNVKVAPLNVKSLFDNWTLFKNTTGIPPEFDKLKVSPVSVYVKPGFVAVNDWLEEEVPEYCEGIWKPLAV